MSSIFNWLSNNNSDLKNIENEEAEKKILEYSEDNTVNQIINSIENNQTENLNEPENDLENESDNESDNDFENDSDNESGYESGYESELEDETNCINNIENKINTYLMHFPEMEVLNETCNKKNLKIMYEKLRVIYDNTSDATKVWTIFIGSMYLNITEYVIFIGFMKFLLFDKKNKKNEKDN